MLHKYSFTNNTASQALRKINRHKSDDLKNIRPTINGICRRARKYENSARRLQYPGIVPMERLNESQNNIGHEIKEYKTKTVT